MVTFTQLITGLTQYINESLNAGNNNTFLLKFLLKLLLRSKDVALNVLKDKYGTFMDMFQIMEGDNINLKALYEAAKETMNETPYKFDTPIGVLTVTPADLTKAYETIINAC